MLERRLDTRDDPPNLVAAYRNAERLLDAMELEELDALDLLLGDVAVGAMARMSLIREVEPAILRLRHSRFR